MAKRRLALDVAIETYPVKGTKRRTGGARPGLAWRRDVFDAVRKAAAEQNRRYSATDRLRVEVLLYLNDRQMQSLDVDNLIKHVGDALQGRLAGGGKKRVHRDAVLPNDVQIFSWTVEKRTPHSPKLKSRLRIRGYKEPRGP